MLIRCFYPFASQHGISWLISCALWVPRVVAVAVTVHTYPRRPKESGSATTADAASLQPARGSQPAAAAAPQLEAAVCVTVRGATVAGEGGDPGLPWVRRLADCLAVGGDAPPLPDAPLVATDVSVVLQACVLLPCAAVHRREHRIDRLLDCVWCGFPVSCAATPRMMLCHALPLRKIHRY